MTKTMRLDRLAGAWAFSALSWLSLLGGALLAVLLLLGFERPHGGALTASGLLMVSLPIAVFVHLYAASGLTPEERRLWLRELTSPRFPWTVAAYWRCRNRGALARRMGRRARRH
jgi:hypothetical protein